MSSPEVWFNGLPKVTRYYFAAAFGTTILVSLGMMSPAYFYLDFDLVFKKFQIWRLVTCFLFFGKFGIPFIFQMFILVQYVGKVETGVFENSSKGTADTLFLFLFNGLVMMCISYLFPNWGLYFPGPGLVFSCLYVWSRTDPYAAVVMYGFKFKAWHFPFVLLAINALMGNSSMSILGIFVGHFYFFLWRIIPHVYGVSLLSTPEFMYRALASDTVQARFNWQQAGGGRLN